MADINEILGRQINSVKELKTAIKELQDSLVGLDAESDEFKTTTQQLSAAQDELNKVTRAGKTDTDAAKDSIVGMKNEYKALYDQYKLLSDEQRNSDFGKNMASSLESLSTKINEAQKNVGSFKDNIGRYSEGVTDAFNKMGVSAGALKGPLQAAKVGSEGLNGAFKALAANPIMLAITAIVAILVKAAAAIKENEELTNRLREAMSVFKPVLDAVSNAFDFLAGLIVKVVEGFAKFSAKVLSIIPGMGKAIKSHQDLARATNELTKAQRENSVVLSKKQEEVEALRAEAAATTDLTEKRAILEEAKAKQMEIDQAYVDMAQEELRIMQEYASKTANSAEANDKLAAAQKKVNDALAQGQRHQKEYNEQIKSTNQSTKAATSSAKDYREEAKKLHEQLIEDNKTEITKLTEKYEKERKLLVKYGYDTNLLDKKFSKDSLEIVVKTVNERTEKEREMYTSSLREYNKYIQQQRELLKDSPTELTEFDKEISEEILERYSNINEALMASQRKMFQEGSFDLVNAFTVAQSNANSQLLLTDFEGMLKLLKDKIEATAGAEKNSLQGIWHETYEGALKAMEKLGPEKWAAYTKPIQEQIDSLRTAYGVSIETLEELDRLTEIEEKNLKALKKAFTEALGEEQIKRIEEVIKSTNEASMQLELDLVRNSSEKPIKLFRELSVMAAENTYDSLSAQKKAYEVELADFKGTQEQKIEMLYKYYDVVKQLREAELNLQELNRQRTEEMFESLIDLSDRMAGSLSTYRSSQEQLIESQLKAGQIDEREAERKKKRLLNLQKVETAFSIATITADAAAGIFKVWQGYATEIGQINPQTAAATGPAAAGTLAALNTKSLVTAIAKTAGLASTAIAQIAAARNGVVTAQNNLAAESGGGGSSSSAGVAATPQVVDSTPYTYTRTIQTQDEKDELNRPIVCSVVDIEDALEVRKVRIEEASF